MSTVRFGFKYRSTLIKGHMLGSENIHLFPQQHVRFRNTSGWNEPLSVRISSPFKIVQFSN